MTFPQSNAQGLLVSPRFFRRVAIISLFIACLAILVLIFAPWQQTVVGSGKVTVFSPMQRPQNIEAQLSGRLKQWFVFEGQRVKAGQIIANLEDLDAKFLDPNQLVNMETQKTALLQRKAATQSRFSALQRQLSALEQSQQAAIPGAGQKIAQNKQRLIVNRQGLEAAQQNSLTANIQFNRLKDLYEKGLRSKRDFELGELDKVRAETAVQQAMAQLKVAGQDVSVAGFDQAKIMGDTTAALANIAAAQASAQETVASVNNDLAKLTVDIQNIKGRISQRQVKSPITGKVVRLMSVGSGETVGEGDILAVVVPDTQDQAVELYVSDWDVPLVSAGRQVRLQFAGWPSLQFSGWPMVAGGTFGGLVAVVDALDDGKGRYRILVKPDLKAIKEGKDDPWPSGNYLRPGTQATGWIMLDTVSVGYELWRQFNAFTPTLKEKPDEGGDKKEKPVKRKAKK